MHTEATVAAGSPAPSAPPPSAASSLRYMPGLDVVRGIAIAMVMVYHGLMPQHVFDSPSPVLAWLHGFIYLLRFGVHLFFILSGFLITGILIDSRGQPDYFRNFYIRRALRIVPAYLLILLVLMLTHSITWRYLAVCLLYFCNMTGLFGTTPQYGPFWSLSVEEQFYLTWPFVVHRISLRALARVCAGMILLTPVLRFAFRYGPLPLRDIQYKTWVLLDFFGAGGALAIAVRSARLRPYLKHAVTPLLIAGAILLAGQFLLPSPSTPFTINLSFATMLEPWLLGFTGLVLLAVLRPGIASLAIARPLIFLANISYGLYLCHQLIFYFIETYWHLSPTLGIGILPQVLVRFLAEAAISVAIAYLSRNTMEQFFLRMKPKHPSTALRSQPQSEMT